MEAEIQKCHLPAKSELSKQQQLAYFCDAYHFKSKKTKRSPMEVWLAHMATTPTWINVLMTMRNKIVALFGLKDLGQIGFTNENKTFDEYKLGDNLGIFTLSFISEKGIILTDSDKHLDVSVSVFKANESTEYFTISTLVQTHNIFGKIYMLFVKPMHQLIVPATIKRAEFS